MHFFDFGGMFQYNSSLISHHDANDIVKNFVHSLKKNNLGMKLIDALQNLEIN